MFMCGSKAQQNTMVSSMQTTISPELCSVRPDEQGKGRKESYVKTCFPASDFITMQNHKVKTKLQKTV